MMELVKRETCPQYVARRLSEGWRITERDGFNIILQSPDGILRPVDLRNDVETLRPNAPGDECFISAQTGCSVCPNHFNCVDEAIADDATTTVQHTNPDWVRDLYNLPASTGTGVINFIKVYVKCLAEGSLWYDARYKIAIKSDSTVTETAPITASGTIWEYYTNQWNLNPAPPGTDAWTWADIDALQIGIAIYGSGRGAAYCTQIYVEVDYTPPSGWTGTISGVTDPAKVMGVDVADIATIKGVA